MDLCSLNKFEIYKRDWNFPIQVHEICQPGSPYKGKAVTFQKTMKVPLVLGQCFGLNPVLGVTELDASKLRFSYQSWRFLYSLISIIAQGFLVLLCTMKLFRDTDSTLGSYTAIMFYTMSCLTSISFVRIAMKWPRLCMYIARTEASDPNMDVGLPKRCKLIGILILSFAFLENILYDLHGMAIAVDCEPDMNVYETYIMHIYPWIYMYLPYNVGVGIVTQLLNVQSTFNWNYVDVFIICISLYLASRLEQVNQRIIAVRGKYVPQYFWRSMREDYNRATSLVRMVDDIMGGIVFISFANNLFFICLQLLHTLTKGIRFTPRCLPENGPDLRPFYGYEQAIYFVYSVVFLLIRSLSVCMTAARVHTASKAPAQALYDVPSAAYCIEIQRFLSQIHGDTVALSGLQFFNVKRGLVLSTVQRVSPPRTLRYPPEEGHRLWLKLSRNHFIPYHIAGTIVTYELVLMQFAGVSPTSPSPT